MSSKNIKPDALFGREKEISYLKQSLESKQAEFTAVYGRRRVGKTFLIHEYYHNKGVYFELTGLHKGTLTEQLNNFTDSFRGLFYPDVDIKTPTSWREAFAKLTTEMAKVSISRKIILFFDELPWLASKRSKFISMLDYYWNTKWSRMNNVKLIVCGSAASWMLKKVINAKGGLHNRITRRLLLQPFNLAQTASYLKKRGFNLTNKQVLDIYMVMGGIPFYLDQLNKNHSIAQNVNQICFSPDGLLTNEFSRLFESLFDAYTVNTKIVAAIADRRYGLKRNELLKQLKMKSGASFNDRIDELVAAGFIEKFIPIQKKTKDQYFKIIDEFTLFYFQWIEPMQSGSLKIANQAYWQSIIQSNNWNNWVGYSFEQICYKHSKQIIKAIGLEKIPTLIGTWHFSPQQKQSSSILQQGAQIDLLFDRSDDAITICEIKYNNEKPFVIDRDYAKKLMNKLEIFEKQTKTRKQLFLAMITTQGLKQTPWVDELVNYQVTLDDIFEDT